MKTFKQLKVGDNIYVWDCMNQYVIIGEITHIKKKWKYRQFTMNIILGAKDYVKACLKVDRKSRNQFNMYHYQFSIERDIFYYISTDFDRTISSLIEFSNEVYNSINRRS